MPPNERLDPARAIDAAIGGSMIENSGLRVGEAKRDAIAGAVRARRNPRRVCDVPQRPVCSTVRSKALRPPLPSASASNAASSSRSMRAVNIAVSLVGDASCGADDMPRRGNVIRRTAAIPILPLKHLPPKSASTCATWHTPICLEAMKSRKERLALGASVGHCRRSPLRRRD